MVVKRTTVAVGLLGDHIHRDVLQVIFLKQFPECVFDAFYRTNPDGNAFSICAGLEQVIDYVGRYGLWLVR